MPHEWVRVIKDDPPRVITFAEDPERDSCPLECTVDTSAPQFQYSEHPSMITVVGELPSWLRGQVGQTNPSSGTIIDAFEGDFLSWINTLDLREPTIRKAFCRNAKGEFLLKSESVADYLRLVSHELSDAVCFLGPNLVKDFCDWVCSCTRSTRCERTPRSDRPSALVVLSESDNEATFAREFNEFLDDTVSRQLDPDLTDIFAQVESKLFAKVHFCITAGSRLPPELFTTVVRQRRTDRRRRRHLWNREEFLTLLLITIKELPVNSAHIDPVRALVPDYSGLDLAQHKIWPIFLRSASTDKLVKEAIEVMGCWLARIALRYRHGSTHSPLSVPSTD